MNNLIYINIIYKNKSKISNAQTIKKQKSHGRYKYF